MNKSNTSFLFFKFINLFFYCTDRFMICKKILAHISIALTSMFASLPHGFSAKPGFMPAATHCSSILSDEHFTPLEQPVELGSTGIIRPFKVSNGYVVSSIHAEHDPALNFVIHELSTGRIAQRFYANDINASRHSISIANGFLFSLDYAYSNGWSIKRWKMGELAKEPVSFHTKRHFEFSGFTVSPDGNHALLHGYSPSYLISLNKDGPIVTAISGKSVPTNSGLFTKASFSADGKTFFITFPGMFNDQLALGDTATGELLHNFDLSTAMNCRRIYEAYFLGDDWILLTVDQDSLMDRSGFRLINVKTREVKSIQGLPWYQLGWNIPVYQGKIAALLPKDGEGQPYLLDLRSARVKPLLKNTGSKVRAVSFFKSEPLGIALFSDGKIGLFEPIEGNISPGEPLFTPADDHYPHFDARILVSDENGSLVIAPGNPHAPVRKWSLKEF